MNALVTSTPADEAFFAPAGLVFTITEVTLQAVNATDPSLNLSSLNDLDVLNRPLAGFDALLGTLQDKLDKPGDEAGKKALPVFARLAERSYGAGIVEFRCTEETRQQLKDAGFDKENQWLDRFAWAPVVSKNKKFSRFTELSKEFDLLKILKDLQSEGKLDSVQAGAFVKALHDLSRIRFGAGRVRLALSEPAYGEIGRDWSGELRFEVRPEFEPEHESEVPDPGPFERWQIDLSAELDGRRLVWEPLKHEAGEATTKLKEVKVDQDNAGAENKDAGQAGQALNNWLTGRSTGDILHLEARITPKSSTDGFAQVLRFPLRFVEKDVLPLPLAPAFIHFEDPEYNRLLATPAARCIRHRGRGG